MRGLLLGLLLWQAAEVASAPRYFKYQREVTVPAGADGGQACVLLDTAVYAHGAASLKDVRLREGGREVPYVVTLSEPAEEESEPAEVRSLGMRGERIVFDLKMPGRAYTDVALELGGRDFVAAAEVSGVDGKKATQLGTFTLFDLSGKGLSRSTTLHLQESRFAMLHVEMRVSGKVAATPAMVLGATVPPDREAQTVYTVVASSGVTEEGRATVARFRLPAHVPVERVSVVLVPGFAGNFSRAVEVTARALGAGGEVERVAGRIERVRMGEMRMEELGVPATLGANLQADAEVAVRIDNGDAAPLPVEAVRLEMRERRLCFPVAGAGTMTLLYGDAALTAPMYDFARVFVPGTGVVAGRLGPEMRNAGWVARAETVRSLTERHPEVLWVALLGVVCVLAVVAMHSGRRVRR